MLVFSPREVAIGAAVLKETSGALENAFDSRRLAGDKKVIPVEVDPVQYRSVEEMDQSSMAVTSMVTPPHTTPARQKAVPSAALLMQAVSLAFDVRLADLHSPVRGRAEVALARQIAMYLARVTLGLTFKGAGNLFNRDRTTAAHACRRVEDLRAENR